MADAADRMFANLPAVFRNHDETGDLARLLGVLESYLLSGGTIDDCPLHGLEEYLEQIPTIFSPIGSDQYQLGSRHTPDQFVHWMATWLSFTPHELFSIDALRRILAGIVPFYGFRGTRDYLDRLLKLCFADDIATVHIDDRPTAGFTIGTSTLGVDTRLAVSRPFYFKVVIECPERLSGLAASHDSESLQRRLRAVVNFAKPAHTIYELEVRTSPHVAHANESVRH